MASVKSNLVFLECLGSSFEFWGFAFLRMNFKYSSFLFFAWRIKFYAINIPKFLIMNSLGVRKRKEKNRKKRKGGRQRVK